jgi:hypothetical protein
VLAKSEFDLRKFNAIQHGIDTGSNRPVKKKNSAYTLGVFESHSSELKQPLFSNECCFGAVRRFDFHLPIC